MFVEIKMNRGAELFNTGGILRVAQAADGKARLSLFGMPQPIETDESYEDVKKKALGVIASLAGQGGSDVEAGGDE